MSVTYGVVVNTHPGDVASVADLVQEVESGSAANGYEPKYEPQPLLFLSPLRRPVFNVGEVLLLNPDGREVPYPGRKPAKWRVTIEEFDDVDAALARANAAFADSLDGEERT